MNSRKFIVHFFSELNSVVKKISVEEVDKAIELLFEAWKEGKQVFMAGNGGSASTATHFASDLAKSTSIGGKPRFQTIALTDNIPWITSITNDLGWSEVYVEQLRSLMRKGDIFVAISVHGGSGSDKAGPWSQNLLKAAKFVKESRGKVLGITGFDGGILRKVADVCIVVPVDSVEKIEGLHLVLIHLICERLRELIAKF